MEVGLGELSFLVPGPVVSPPSRQARDRLAASHRVARSILESGDAVTGSCGDVLMQ